MTLSLHPETRIVQHPSLGDSVFLFNSKHNSWAAMSPQSYHYLEYLVTEGEDALALGLRMGFSREEIEQFLTYLTDRGLLLASDQTVDKDTSYSLQTCYLHITQACNLHCRTCYSWRENRNRLRGELSFEQIDAVLEQLVALHLSHLVISGGEPLLRRDLPDILYLAKKKHHIQKITLITNGTLVSNNLAAVLAPFVDEVNVSIDGPTEEINAQIRGESNFERALQGIKAFRQYMSTKSVKLISTIHHKNLQYIQEIRNLAKKLEVETTFSMFIGVGAGSLTEAQELVLTQQDLRYVSEVIHGWGNVEVDLDGGIRDRSQHKATSEPLEMAMGVKEGCGVGYKIIAIDYDGSVYPCHMLMRPELRIGTAPYKSLGNILEESALARFFRSLHVDLVETCKKCPVRYFCGGSCRASAYNAYSNLLAYDPACEISRSFIYSALRPLIETSNNA